MSKARLTCNETQIESHFSNAEYKDKCNLATKQTEEETIETIETISFLIKTEQNRTFDEAEGMKIN
jgi:hypothetical protein